MKRARTRKSTAAERVARDRLGDAVRAAIPALEALLEAVRDPDAVEAPRPRQIERLADVTRRAVGWLWETAAATSAQGGRRKTSPISVV